MGENILALALISIAALVQGYSGFGFGIVAMALLVLSGLPLESGALMATFVGVAVIATLLWLSWSNGPIHWRGVGLLLIGALIGLPIGYWFLSRFGAGPAPQLVLGTLLILFAIYGLFRRRGTVRLPQTAAIPLGMLSGFVGGAFISGGPPAVVYLSGQADDPRIMKPSIQMILLIILFMRIAFAATLGDLDDTDLWMHTALTIPAALIALWLGHQLSRIGSAGFHRMMAQIALGLFGLLLIGLTLQRGFA
ncbi:MAG: TSUP family transporter [Planctomycetota bacterium]